MQFHVEVMGEDDVLRIVVHSQRAIQNAEPAFRRFMSNLRGHIIKQFSTEGAHMGTPWPALDPDYASWKQATYGPRKILHREGDLRRSLVEKAHAMSINETTRDEMSYGTLVPYAMAHHEGKGVPQRQLFAWTEELKADMARLLRGHVVIEGEEA